ncbi:MAG: hypothetical protein ACLQU3_32355 [Limisphaerales bacterium]
MGFAAVLSKGDERGETSRTSNVQSTPRVNAILEDGRVLFCGKRAFSVLVLALVVGEMGSELCRSLGGQNSRRDGHNRVTW